jgi:hypothetical protein
VRVAKSNIFLKELDLVVLSWKDNECNLLTSESTSALFSRKATLLCFPVVYSKRRCFCLRLSILHALHADIVDDRQLKLSGLQWHAVHAAFDGKLSFNYYNTGT